MSSLPTDDELFPLENTADAPTAALRDLKIRSDWPEPPGVSAVAAAEPPAGLWSRLRRGFFSIVDGKEQRPRRPIYDEGGNEVDRERRFNYIVGSLIDYSLQTWHTAVTSCVERAMENARILGLRGRDVTAYASSVCLASPPALADMTTLVICVDQQHERQVVDAQEQRVREGAVDRLVVDGQIVYGERGGRRAVVVLSGFYLVDFVQMRGEGAQTESEEAWRSRLERARSGEADAWSVLLMALPSHRTGGREAVAWPGDATVYADCRVLAALLATSAKSHLDTVGPSSFAKCSTTRAPVTTPIPPLGERPACHTASAHR